MRNTVQLSSTLGELLGLRLAGSCCTPRPRWLDRLDEKESIVLRTMHSALVTTIRVRHY
ncbi:hypothetical protein [Parendozoicomonas haliclonae]|uniref:hypothetical protein n=1 Tax=Parendozoicomonas haliclonae TaxID=1960125 RepID=UPI0013FD3CDE|nr:hypothetical protein [Parendozoicomonas haliclonae]